MKALTLKMFLVSLHISNFFWIVFHHIKQLLDKMVLYLIE